MRDTIIEIIRTVGAQPGAAVEGIDLFDSGVLDSLGFIELLDALERAFGVEIQPTQVSPDAWRSVDSIEALMRSLTGDAG